MLDDVDVGEGYRLLTKDDIRMPGDEMYVYAELWCTIYPDYGERYGKSGSTDTEGTYRRKVEGETQT